MGRLRRLRVRGDSWNFRPLQRTFVAELVFDDIEERVMRAIEQRVAHFDRFPGGDNGVSQKSVELARLRRFRHRIDAATGEDVMEIGAAEAPISFNDDLFAGRFERVECGVCSAVLRPDDTALERFDDPYGMQYFGTERRCRCGAAIAYRIEGMRRP